ncbi:MAG: uracil-DNA glycosylase [Alphaproteobacteria bacterium 64-6]|nr:MAG: uracil-DNA glycosylase [Alphaproteobacteria bacterium 64-6]
MVPAMIDAEDRPGMATLLAWWREMGVDGALDESGTDWLAREGAVPGQAFALQKVEPQKAEPPAASPRPAPAAQRSAPAPGRFDAPPAGDTAPRRFPTAPPDAAALSARQAARGAATLDALRAVLERFDGCALKATAKSLCFYRGRPDARLMIVGEAPGREEDLAGKPFVGRAGQLLDKMLAAIGLGEDDVHITNVVYWRPPGNRTPTPQEVQVCRPFLERQIELVAPDVIMTLGGPAATALLGIEGGIMRARGRWRELEVAGRKVPAMPTLHPAYLLRTPIGKRLAWRDLLAIQERLLGSRGK